MTRIIAALWGFILDLILPTDPDWRCDQCGAQDMDCDCQDPIS